MADARIVNALLEGVALEGGLLAQVHAALAAKDSCELSALTQNFPPLSRQGLLALVQLYGDEKVLLEAQKVLQSFPAVGPALSNLKWLADHLEGARVSFDLADLRGYAYYTGARFSIYAPGASDALVRGGRYDEVGAVFGRNRPATGFSLDVKALVGVLAPRPLRAAIRAPWREVPDLRAAIASLRAQGQTVVCALPGHESEVEEFHCDRELIQVAGQWVVQAV
jgi:ATP phosphoribosyltransferase regulatory subunit